MATVVTGHFQKQGTRLLVTLEAIDTGTERLMWQTNLTGSSQDLIGMQEQLAKQVRPGCCRSWARPEASWKPAHAPKIRKLTIFIYAVWLFPRCHSQKEAMKMLEHAVGLDPSYAPAWEALGLRYYYDATYSGGGEEMFQRSNSA